MNLTQVAHALRALAAAIEAPDAPAATTAPVTASPAPAPAAAPTAPKPRGRPPKGVEGAQPGPTAAAPVAPVAPAAAEAPKTSAPAAAPSNLTHADLVPAFKKAALDHGAEFVRGLLKTRGAKTFNDVKDLAQFKAELEGGPQAATSAVDDLLG